MPDTPSSNLFKRREKKVLVKEKVLVEELKTLQKIHCKPCPADYEACQRCRFHQITNKLLAEALSELRRPAAREAEFIFALPEVRKAVQP